MKNIFELLNSFGLHININENTSPIFFIGLGFLILNLIVFFSVLNISFYLISIYLINTNKYLATISSTYPYIHKIIKYYNSTRISFIILELMFLFGSLGYMISVCIRILVNLS
nr:hypothetical protein [Trametes versicolor]